MDTPRSIGTPLAGVRRVARTDIEEFLDQVDLYEVMEAQNKVTEFVATGVQIWRMPSGANSVLEKMGSSDFPYVVREYGLSLLGAITASLRIA